MNNTNQNETLYKVSTPQSSQDAVYLDGLMPESQLMMRIKNMFSVCGYIKKETVLNLIKEETTTMNMKISKLSKGIELLEEKVSDIENLKVEERLSQLEKGVSEISSYVNANKMASSNAYTEGLSIFIKLNERLSDFLQSHGAENTNKLAEYLYCPSNKSANEISSLIKDETLKIKVSQYIKDIDDFYLHNINGINKFLEETNLSNFESHITDPKVTKFNSELHEAAFFGETLQNEDSFNCTIRLGCKFPNFKRGDIKAKVYKEKL